MLSFVKNKYLISFFFFIFFLFSCQKSLAASKYWIGSENGNISDASNWASSAGGCGVGTTVTPPGTSDVAYFTSSCTNGANINEAWNVAGINIAGGNINQNANINIGFSGLYQSGGVFTGSSSGIGISGTFSLSGGTMTATSGTMSVRRDVIISSPATFTHNSGTISLSGNYDGNSSIDAPGFVFNKIIINRSFSGFATRTFTIATGTTVPLGDNPSITYANTCSDISCRSNIINNGLITAGEGSLTMTLTGRNGSTRENLINNGTIDFSSLTSANIDGSFLNTSGKTINLSSLPSLTIYNIGNSGTINLGSGSTFTFNGWFSNSSGANFITKSGLNVFNMTSSFIINSGSSFPTSNVSLNLNGTNCLGSNIDASTVTFNTPVIIDRSLACLSNITVTIYENTTIPLGNNPTVRIINSSNDPSAYAYLVNNGTITAGSGTLNMHITRRWGGVNPEPFTNNGTLDFSSLSAINFNADLVNSSGSKFFAPSNINIGSSGYINIDSGSSFPSTIGALVLDNNTSYGNPKTTTYSSFTKTGASTLALGQGFTTADFSISAGTISNPASTQTISVTGNFTQSGGTLGGSNLPFIFSGTSNQSVNKTSGTFSSPFTVNKSSGHLSLSSAFSNSSSCTIQQGIFDLNGQAFTCGDSFVVQSGGTLRMFGNETPTTPELNSGSTVSFKGDGDAASDTFTITNFGTTFSNLSFDNSGIGGTDTFVLGAGITVTGNISINSGNFDVSTDNYPITLLGNWSNSTNFIPRNGTVFLTGTNQSISGSSTFYNLSKIVSSSDTLIFPADSSKTQTIQGTLTLKGILDNLLTVKSSQDDVQAKINPSSTDLEYLAVQDINNLGDDINVSGLNITDLGNNDGWLFNNYPTATAPSSISQLTNGSGYISFQTTVSDPNNNNTKLKVEYSPDNGSHWYKAHLVSVNPLTGTADLSNSEAYQIGTSNSIDTSSGEILLAIVWDTKSDQNEGGSLNNLDPLAVKLRVQANNFTSDSTWATSDSFRVDNIAPPVSISDPSSILTKSGPINYTVTYSENTAVSLGVSDIVLNKTGTANAIVSISGTGNTTRTIIISNITGDGSLGISLNPNTATDSVGNTAPAIAQANTIVVDNTPPVITLLGSSSFKMYKGSVYSDAGSVAQDNRDGNITSRISTSGFLNTSVVGTYQITYDVGDTVGNLATQVIRTVEVLDLPSNSQILGTGATTTPTNPIVVVGNNDTSPAVITVPSGVNNAQINVAAMTVSSGTTSSAIIPFSLNINAQTTFGTVNLNIPSNIEFVAENNTWSGKINIAQIQENPSVTPIVEEGKSANVSSVIEVGYGETKLTFDKAVRILIPNQAGQYVGYSRGSNFYQITQNCSADTQEAGNALEPEADCKIDVGADLVVWTKHFTEFTTYNQSVPTPTPTQAPSNNNNNASSPSSSSSSSSSSSPAPATPQITSVRYLKPGSVRITWNPVDNANSWSVLYGVKPGQYIHGIHNFGDNSSRSIDINLLQRRIYYFVLKANNNGTGSPNSSEWRVSVSASGIRTKTTQAIQTTQATQKITTNPVSSKINIPSMPKSIWQILKSWFK